jgi:hypothetical protein
MRDFYTGELKVFFFSKKRQSDGDGFANEAFAPPQTRPIDLDKWTNYVEKVRKNQIPGDMVGLYPHHREVYAAQALKLALSRLADRGKVEVRIICADSRVFPAEKLKSSLRILAANDNVRLIFRSADANPRHMPIANAVSELSPHSVLCIAPDPTQPLGSMIVVDRDVCLTSGELALDESSYNFAAENTLECGVVMNFNNPDGAKTSATTFDLLWDALSGTS